LERIGVFILAYGSRAAALVDGFTRSNQYDVELFIVDKQRNPFNLERAKEHVVVPSLDLDETCKFVRKHRDEIDFGMVGPEKPIIAGIRDRIEEETGIPVICPTKKYAIEGSKVAQRLLFQEVAPKVNPRFEVFDPKDYGDLDQVKKALYSWLDELDNRVAVKPDAPAAGKGVGVWGDHFNTRSQLYEHFLANFKDGPVIVEEKVEGEESSFQAFCDGKHLVPLPETRDYKRAFDDDRGPNTGGMGSYKDKVNHLPFMDEKDWREEIKIVERIFRKLKGGGTNPGLRGIPFYMAFIHTEKGPMILENNSRPGDPEIMNIIPVVKDDLVDTCLKMINGSLTRIELMKKATVVTYKVPPNYGGYMDEFPERVHHQETGRPIALPMAEYLKSKYADDLRIYPGSMEVRGNGHSYALGSRTVCSIGIGDTIQDARRISLEGLAAIKGGALWNRTDIAAQNQINRSISHMEKLHKI